MNRRAVLATIGGLAATPGCITTGRQADDDPLDLPDERVYPLDENAEYNSVLVKSSYLSAVDGVEYNNPEKGSIETWNPGEENYIGFARFWAENLSNGEKEYPRWESFKLVTPDGIENPITETLDGTSVEEIREEEHVPPVTWPESSGIDSNYSRGWTAVYTLPKTELSNVAVKWERPGGEPVYWRAQE